MSKNSTRRITLGAVCKLLQSGDSIPSSKITDMGNYPVFGANGMRGYTQNKNFTGSCAIIGRQGAYCGNVHYYSGEAYMTEHAVIAEPNNKANARFLAYYLGLLPLIRLQGQSAQPGLAVSNLRKLKLELPEMAVQERVAKLLSALDSKIEHNKRMSERLEKQAQLLYDYWFLQFDFPDENGRPYRSRGGKMVWNETLKREIPAGWKVASLSSYLDDTSTGDWGKDEPSGNYTQRVYCIRGADILNVDALPIRFILKKNSHKFLLPNDTVIEVSGGSPTQATGRSAFISECTLGRYDSPLICTNFCQVLRQKDTAYARYFYQLWNKLYDAGIMFNYEGKTSGIKNLLVGAFCSIKWYFPPREIAEQFNDLIYPIIARLEHIKQEQKSLTSQRDYLLPLLMTGQVRVEA